MSRRPSKDQSTRAGVRGPRRSPPERNRAAPAAREHQRLSLLADVGRALAAPVDDGVDLPAIARRASTGFADIALVDLVGDDGVPRRVAAADHGRRARGGVPGAPQLEALRGGRTALLPDCARARLAEAVGAPVAEALPAGRTASLLVVPLAARDAILGVLTLAAWRAGEPFTARDLDAGEELATRLAVALANARLYRWAREVANVKNELLFATAHDLRTPLHALRLSLASQAGQAPAVERRSSGPAIHRMGRLAEHMNRVLDDLFVVRGVESGAAPFHAAEHDVAGLLEGVRDLCSPIARDKGVVLRVQPTPARCAVRCDGDRTLRVFTNVVGNALKFTPPGGAVDLLAQPGPTEVRFAVRDTGPGVSREDLDRMFLKHWQARKDAHDGCGLGLYVARRLVEAQGGAIWCESRPQKGATVFFTLPAAPARPR